MPILEVTEATFEKEVLRSELPVLIDLYADWCAPCKQMAPMVQELATEFESKLKVVKVNIDKCPLLAQSFRVQSIPMFILIHQGQIVDQLLGAAPKEALKKFIKRVVPSDASEVSPQDLFQLLADQQALAIDVRDDASYKRYRIPGAAHIPSEKIAERKAELRPTDGRIRVLYARSTDEAKTLAENLRKEGIQVGFLAGGFLHWEADGLQVDRGTS